MERVAKKTSGEIFKQMKNACAIAEQVQFVAMAARREDLCDVSFFDGVFLSKLVAFSEKIGVPDEICGFFSYVGKYSFRDFPDRLGTPLSRGGKADDRPIKNGTLSLDFCRKVADLLVFAEACVNEATKVLSSSANEKECRDVCGFASVLSGITEIAYRSVVRVCFPLASVGPFKCISTVYSKSFPFRSAKIALSKTRSLSKERNVSEFFCDRDVCEVTRDATLAILKLAVASLHYMRDASGKKEMSLDESGVDSLFALAKDFLNKGVFVSNKSNPLFLHVNSVASLLLLRAVDMYYDSGRKCDAGTCFCETCRRIEAFNDVVCF